MRKIDFYYWADQCPPGWFLDPGYIDLGLIYYEERHFCKNAFNKEEPYRYLSDKK